MRTCISEETSSVVHVSKMPFDFKTICNICHQPVAVNGDSRAFVHVTASLNCPEHNVANTVENEESDLIPENTPWMHKWNNCTDADDKEFVNFEAQCMSSAAFGVLCVQCDQISVVRIL